MNRKDAAVFKAMGSCSDGRIWMRSAKIKSLREAWEKCHRSDWMIWALQQIGFKDESKLRLFAGECMRKLPIGNGRTVWDLLSDERSRHAVEVAERYARGEATEEERAAAYDAAYDAARSADRAAAFASHDALAAAFAAYEAYCAVAYEAYCAADYAVRAVAYIASCDAVCSTARITQADILRSMVSWDEDIVPVLEKYKQGLKA